jgi:SAM-dependent methyltransferase
MKAGLLDPYEQSLRAAGALSVVDELGRVLALDVPRWLSAVDAADRTVLDRCRGPVLDLGCGPGRFVVALAGRGVPALGVDLAPAAVQLTRSRGGAALQRDLFAPLPGEGRWPTVLLVDGNIGIGGDVSRLLGRVTTVLESGGRLLVEAAPDDCDERLRVRFHRHGRPEGATFRWARVGLTALRAHAATSRLQTIGSWQRNGRVFAELRRP